MTPEGIEARYSGTGLGRKSLEELFDTVGMAHTEALSRLAAAGIPAKPEDNARELADRHGVSPIDLLKILLIFGHKRDDQ